MATMTNWKCIKLLRNDKFYLGQSAKSRQKFYENYDSCIHTCNLLGEIVAHCYLGGVSAIALGLLGMIALASCAPVTSKGSSQTSAVSNTPNSGQTVIPTTFYRTLKDVPNVPQATARYGGSTTFAPLRGELAAQIEQTHPDFRLSYVEPPLGIKPGSGSGIQMLLEGQLDFSLASRSLKQEEYEAAKNRNFSLGQSPVAIDGIAIYVNPELSLPGLTLSQLKDIYTGRVTNWKELGGQDIAIVPIGRDPSEGGTPEFFYETILKQEPFALAVRSSYVRDTTESLRQVASAPGGISYASAAEVCNQKSIRVLPVARDGSPRLISPCDGNQVSREDLADDSYPLTRRLFIVIKKDGDLTEKVGTAYVNLLLSDEGQKFISQAGFVPIR